MGSKVKRYYITTSYGMRGYYAMQVVEYTDGFAEPNQTGCGSYPTREGAAEEARAWALAEGQEFVP